MSTPRTLSAEKSLVPGWATGTITLGCDYNPEQWDESVWLDDIALMTELGVDLVAINIFGWAQLQPTPGSFDFGRLDRIVELLHAAGIRINLGTGTSSPPPWLARLHPETLPQAADGTIAWPGGRQAWCPSSPVFREKSLELVSAMVERYGAHPAVALWHVSNELGCHNALCYCDTSAAAFRAWLQRRYETLDTLNDAWGTAFWSQRVGDWADVLPPRTTRSAANPAQALDFARFSSDELLASYRAEAAVVRAGSAAPVTTNLMVTAHISTQDYFGWVDDLDLIANDHYLDHRLPDPLAELAFSADLTRGLAKGDPWMLMETSTSAVSWQPINHAKRDGELVRTVLGHVARGADSICFFQWRASRRGAEKFHSALLPHGGTGNSGWAQSLELSAVLDRLSPIVGSRVAARAAMVFSWPAWWAAEGDAQPSGLLRYLPEAHRYHRALRALGVTVDLVAPGTPLTGYDLVIVPTLYTATDAEAAVIADAAELGATVLITPFSGIVDDTDAIHPGSYPGAFRDLLGIVIDEFRPLAAAQAIRLDSGARGSVWSESIQTRGAAIVDAFTDGPAAGSPALTRREVGEGAAWYVATMLDDESLSDLLVRLCAEADVPVTEVGPDVDLVTRVTDTHEATFVINHRDAPVTVPVSGLDLVTGETVTDTTPVAAGAVRVIVTERSNRGA
ncbi:beta-galactosidase [Pseudolysinimonas yzui]|uniref:Beta-galactosidase n=1 Tax=Pseudolysinimonas yzui TaxID=2708254 RepID=A0A8J3GP92_9MICO|nr:beta-galactosidase [Pseudolysinimonas yzui]GHF10582.1 beta-galactosidase [Pseudolysinimonas yzui]